MTLIHPWALVLGAVGIGLPIFIHWLTRPRPVRLPLSTVRFVQEVVRQRPARHWLRDILVLALRAIAVLLLGWAFARPILGQQSKISSTEDAKVARVILLDVSQSMAAQAQGIQAFERARSVAASYLATQFGLQADLVLAGASARPVFDTLSRNLAAQREELAKVQVRPERLNVQAALARAAELFAATPAAAGLKQELVIVSDFQQTNWGQVDFSPIPKSAAIQLESVAPVQTPANLALLQCGIKGRCEPHRPVRLEAEVANYSPAARQVQAEVNLGAMTYRLECLCPPQSTVTLSTDAEFPEPGWLAGQARLLNVEDALAADNVRPVVVQVRPAPNYILITRQPADRTTTSSYFLAKALTPLPAVAGQPAEKVQWAQPSRIDRQSLQAADLIALDHPGKLSPEVATMLAGLIRYGRPVLYVASEEIDATNLRLLSEAAGNDLRTPVEFMPPQKGQRRQDLTLASVRRDQPPFSVFGDSVLAAVQPLRFAGGLPTWRRTTGLADDILASFNDKSACLVVTTCGQGCLAVLNADLEASNLVRSPVFVPLVSELIERMYGQQQTGKPMPCGEPMASYLPAEAGLPSGLRLTGPAADAEMGDLVEDGMGVMWRWQGASQPGTYLVQRGDAVVYAVAAAIPAEESDLRPIAAAALQKGAAGGREIRYHGSELEQGHDEVWPWLTVACVMCMLAELAALRAFKT